MDATLRQRIAATVLCVVLSGAAAGAAVAQTPDPEQLEQLPQLGPEAPAAVVVPPTTTTTATTPEPAALAHRTTAAEATALPNTGTQPSTVATLGLALIAAGVGLRLRARPL